VVALHHRLGNVALISQLHNEVAGSTEGNLPII
jgi:hypothetical protein